MKATKVTPRQLDLPGSATGAEKTPTTAMKTETMTVSCILGGEVWVLKL